MKNILFIAVFMSLVGCGVTTRGTHKGKLVSAEWSGLIFKTCEVEVQYGDTSSKVENFSSEDEKLCSELQTFIVSGLSLPVTVQYNRQPFKCIACGSRLLIQQVGVGL